MQILTTAVVKGGAGKTTTAAAIAQAAAAAGKKVLAIDLDPQADLTFTIGADQNRPGVYELLHGAKAADLIQTTTQGIDAISAAPNLAAEKTSPGSAMRLQDGIAPIKGNYDLIIIDTAPALTELTFNALQAATALLIPLEADNGSLQGLYQISDIAHQIQAKSNPGLHIIGSVITRYDARSKINRYWHDAIAERGAETGAPLIMAIRAGVAIKEAKGFQQSLFEYAPRSKPAQDYQKLYELIQEA